MLILNFHQRQTVRRSRYANVTTIASTNQVVNRTNPFSGVTPTSIQVDLQQRPDHAPDLVP